MTSYIVETGRVVAVEQGAVWVETIRSSACGSCAARSGCGHRTLAGVLTSDKGLVRAVDSKHLTAAVCSVDDKVEISIQGSTLTKSALALYGVPLALGTVFAFAQVGYSDVAVAVAFFVGLVVGFLILRWADKNGVLGAVEPLLERRLEPSSEPIVVVDRIKVV